MANWATLNTGRPTNAETADLSIISGRCDNNEKGLAGTSSLTNIDINGGAIDGTPIGAASRSSVLATTLGTSGAITASSTLDVTGVTTLTGGVSGATTFDNTVTITGAVVASSTMDITGAVTFASALGTWDNSSFVVSTDYLAASDGIAMATSTSNSSSPSGTVSIKTDSATTPTTIRAEETGILSAKKSTVVTPVKAGDYWRVDTNNSSALVINWIPLGA